MTFLGDVENSPGGREVDFASGPVRNITPCRDTVPVFCHFRWDVKFTRAETTQDWQVCMVDEEPGSWLSRRSSARVLLARQTCQWWVLCVGALGLGVQATLPRGSPGVRTSVMARALCAEVS